MKRNLLKRMLLFGAVSFGLCACNDNEGMSDLSVETGENSRLNISVSAPAAGDVMVKSLTRAADLKGTADESEIKTLNVYLFKKGVGTAETDYTYFMEKTFQTSELQDGSNGKKTCSLDIDPELMDQTVKVVMIANDKPTMTLTKGTTTLDAFRAALATATVNGNDAADKLVGGDKKTGFPMAGLTDEVKLTAAGASASATLVRSVARLDIYHNAPGLTIKSVNITNANNKSCLLGKSVKSELNVPSSLGKISLSPLAEYAELLKNGITRTGEDQAANTHRAFYLYEQSVTDERQSPIVKIEYEIAAGPGKVVKGSVEVKFKKAGGDAQFVNVGRNKIYTIQLGDGKPVDNGNVKAMFKVLDWTNGEEINDVINPDTEAQGR